MSGAILEWLIPAAMFGVMLGMGLALEPEDFRRIADEPRAALVGTLLQLVVMPLAGIGLARAFALEPILAAGLVVIAALAATWTPTLWLLTAALILGIAAPLALGLDLAHTTTIAIELCIKNGVLALFVAISRSEVSRPRCQRSSS